MSPSFHDGANANRTLDLIEKLGVLGRRLNRLVKLASARPPRIGPEPFLALAERYREAGFEHLPKSLCFYGRISSTGPKTHRNSYPPDARRRILRFLKDNGSVKKYAIMQEVDFPGIDNYLHDLVKRGLITRGAGYYQITLFGLEELKRLETP